MHRHSRKLLGLITTLCALTAGLGGCAALPGRPHPAQTIWPLREVATVAGHVTEVVGAPHAIAAPEVAIVFDGKADGLLVPNNPIAGWSAFTIEARVKPDGSGLEEQRFLHIEDESRRRVLLETRVTPDKQWALDTFLFQDAAHKLTLLDRKLLHPTDRWYWVALVYDGRTMSHYVNGVLELQGEVAFTPMSAGRTSLGVRQNLVSWFKGAISEVRFTPAALPATKLQR